MVLEGQSGNVVTFIIARVQGFRTAMHACKCLQQMEATFTKVFRTPRLWLSPWYCRAGAYFGSEDTYDNEGCIDGHNIWFRNDAKIIPFPDHSNSPSQHKVWWKTNVYCRWDTNTQSTIVLLLDPLPALEKQLLEDEDGVIKQLSEDALSRMRQTPSPYYLPSLFALASAQIHHKGGWGIRFWVRSIEMGDVRSAVDGPPKYLLDADPGVRHAIHVKEMLMSLRDSTEQMFKAHQEWIRENILLPQVAITQDRSHIDESAYCFKKRGPRDVNNCKVTSRLKNTITSLVPLLNRLHAHRERLGTSISRLSAIASLEVARASCLDAKVTRTLGYLGTAFLPGTFIAALFSMSFFSINGNGNWGMRSEIWIYFAFAGPLTLAAILGAWSIHTGSLGLRNVKLWLSPNRAGTMPCYNDVSIGSICAKGSVHDTGILSNGLP